MMKQILIRAFCNWIFALLMGVAVLHGQQLPVFNNSAEYQGLINPASLSYDYVEGGYTTSLGVSARQQWIKAPDAPLTMFLRGDHIFENRNTFKMLLGGYAIHDRVGHLSTTGVYGRVAIFSNTKLNNSVRRPIGGFSLGAILGVVQYRIDTERLIEAARESEDLFITNNPAITRPDIGLGATYRFRFGERKKNYLKFGLSVNQLLGSFLTDSREISILKIPHLFQSGSIYFQFKDDRNFNINYLVRKVQNVPVSFDVFARFKFHRSVWIGLGVNSIEHLNVEFGLMLGKFGLYKYKKYKIIFSFNPTGPSYRSQTGESFEMSLVYLLD